MCRVPAPPLPAELKCSSLQGAAPAGLCSLSWQKLEKTLDNSLPTRVFFVCLVSLNALNGCSVFKGMFLVTFTACGDLQTQQTVLIWNLFCSSSFGHASLMSYPAAQGNLWYHQLMQQVLHTRLSSSVPETLTPSLWSVGEQAEENLGRVWLHSATKPACFAWKVICNLSASSVEVVWGFSHSFLLQVH